MRHEVPADCISVECKACGEFIAVFPDASHAERAQIAIDHKVLCPNRGPGPLLNPP